MKILKTNLVDLQFDSYEVRPFKAVEASPELTYQCDIDDTPDYWCVVVLKEDEELYPIVQMDNREDAEILAINMNIRLTDIKNLLSSF